MRRENSDKGFTLVELLVVIVILGILATVAVFAVRGITDESNSSACASDLKTVEQAEEANYADSGSFVSEADLVTNGYLKTQSNLHDISLSGGEYSITTTGTCAGGAPVSAPAPATLSYPSLGFSATTYQGQAAWELAGTAPYTLVIESFGAQFTTLLPDLATIGAAGLASGPHLIVVDTTALGESIDAAVADNLLTGTRDALMVDPGGVQLTTPTGTMSLESLALLLSLDQKCVVSTQPPPVHGFTNPSMIACLSTAYTIG